MDEVQADNYIKNMSNAYYDNDFQVVFGMFSLANSIIDNKEDTHVKALFDKMKLYVILSQVKKLINQGRDIDLVEKIQHFNNHEVFHGDIIKGIIQARIQLLLSDKSEKAVKK